MFGINWGVNWGYNFRPFGEIRILPIYNPRPITRPNPFLPRIGREGRVIAFKRGLLGSLFEDFSEPPPKMRRKNLNGFTIFGFF